MKLKLQIPQLIVFFLFMNTFLAYSQIGVNTTTPEGALDITSSTYGLVPPRIALTNSSTETVTNPQGGSIVAGTTIYNTATAGDVTPGLYIWSGSAWEKAGGGITAVGSMTSGDVFDDSTADDDWLGLGASAGRIEFDNQATDEINFLTANVGIGDTSPDDLLNIYDGSAAAGIAITSAGTNTDPYLGFQITDGTNGFTMGIDDSDGDRFKISTTALGTSDRFEIDTSGNVDVNGPLSVTNGSTSAGKVQFYEDSDDGSNKITLQAQAMASDYTLTLPVDDGASGEALVTDGSGALSWTAAATDTSDTQIATASAIQTTTSNSYSDVTGMTLTTPNDGVTRDYMISFSSELGTDTNWTRGTIIINIGGSNVSATERQVLSRNGKEWPIWMQHLAESVAPNTTIKIRFKSPSENEISLLERNLIIKGQEE